MNRALLIATIGCLAVILGYVGYGVLAWLHDEAPLPVGQNLSRRPGGQEHVPSGRS